jgi:DNA-binding response OmpR family regulator
MKIMICESEEVLLMAIEFRLRKQGYEVEICKKETDLGHALLSEKPNVVILDLDSGNKPGLEQLKVIKNIHPASGVLMLVDPDEEEKITKAFDMGLHDFISKPFKPAELLIRVQRIADAL